MTKERRLGRGLEALLGAVSDRAVLERPAAVEDRVLVDDVPAASADRAGSRLAPPPAGPRISVFEIDANPYQPRRDFAPAELDSLAESLRQHGLLQPVVVRRLGERFQLVAGERRLRAAIQAGWNDVPAQVVEVDDRQSAELALVENLQRKDLNALEKAATFQAYLERYACTQEELAGRLQLDRSTVANLIRLLELPAEVQDAVRGGRVTAGHARALLPLGETAAQVEFCQRIQAEGLSVRRIEELVQETIQAQDAEPLDVIAMPAAKGRTARKNQQLVKLSQEFRAALGTRVELKSGTNGRGKLVIHFDSHAEFERLRLYICGEVQGMSQAG